MLILLSFACSDPVVDSLDSPGGCVYRSLETGDQQTPVSARARALVGEGTWRVPPEPGIRAGNSYTVRWSGGQEEEVELSEEGTIPISLGGLAAGEHTGEILDRRGDPVIELWLVLVDPESTGIVCVGAFDADGLEHTDVAFEEPLTLRAWTADAAGLELDIWIYEHDQGLFTDSTQTIASHRELLEDDTLEVTVTPRYPTDEGEVAGLEIGLRAMLLEPDDGELVAEQYFPIVFY